MTKPKLKLKFVGIENKTILPIRYIPIYNALSSNFDVDFMMNNPNGQPDVIIYSLHSRQYEFLDYDCIRIFFGSEHFFPYELFADYKLTNRSAIKSDIFFHCEMPWEEGFEDFLKGKNSKFMIDKEFEKSQFCNFIYSNKYSKKRNDFISTMLKRYSNKIHCWGRYKRNIEQLQVDNEEITHNIYNVEIMKHYKFTICFENSSIYHSFSEKTGNALRARSIPIYWGGDDIYKFVKKEAFIHAKDFKNFDELMDYIDKVNNDDKLYNSYILDNPFVDDDFVRSQFTENIGETLKQIIELPKPKRKFWQTGIVAKVLFKFLYFFYRIYWKFKSLKRRFIGGI